MYGGVLASLPLDQFIDRANYLNYVEHASDILRHYTDLGFSVALANEPLWLILNAALSEWLGSEAALRVIIFVPASVVAWHAMRQEPRLLLLVFLFLLMPQVIKNHIVHLRQGVAISLFLTGWFSGNRALRALLFAAAPFVHAAFFVVTGLLVLARLARTLRLGPDVRTIVFSGAGIMVASGLGWLASLVGARQAYEYGFSMADVSGLGFLFWSLVLTVYLLQGRAFARVHAFELGAVAFYLSTYLFVEVTARIFESVMLLVLLAALRLTGWRRWVGLSMLVSYGSLQYLFSWRQPWLGFGVS